MSKLEIRPRFKRMSRLTKENILEAFTPVFEDKVESVDGHTSYGWIYLYIPKDDQHLWSPRLSLELEEEEEGITQIHAVFGPNPNVWLLFVFFYSLLGFLAMVILIIGGSRWNLGLSAGILWFIPVLIIIFLAAFLSARAGQELAKEQMWELYNFFHETLDGEVFRPEDFTPTVAA